MPAGSLSALTLPRTRRERSLTALSSRSVLTRTAGSVGSLTISALPAGRSVGTRSSRSVLARSSITSRSVRTLPVRSRSTRAGTPVLSGICRTPGLLSLLCGSLPLRSVGSRCLRGTRLSLLWRLPRGTGRLRLSTRRRLCCRRRDRRLWRRRLCHCGRRGLLRGGGLRLFCLFGLGRLLRRFLLRSGRRLRLRLRLRHDLSFLNRL